MVDEVCCNILGVFFLVITLHESGKSANILYSLQSIQITLMAIDFLGNNIFFQMTAAVCILVHYKLLP